MHDRSSLSPLRASATVIASLMVLVGVPVFLVAAVGWPLPRSMLSSEDLIQAFQRQDVPIEVIMKILAVVAWVAWSQLAWATLVEAVAFARGRAATGRGLVPAAQHAGRQFVTAVAFLAGTLGSIRPAPAATPSLPAVAAAVGPVVDTGATASSPPVGARQPAPSASERVHDVVHGDTFWGLAERYLGSGLRWREIRDRNVGRAVAPGRVLGATEDALDVGWRLVIPAAEPDPAPPGVDVGGTAPAPSSSVRSSGPEAVSGIAGADGAAEGGGASEVRVERGDDLWRLAERRLSTELGRPASAEEVRPYWIEVVATNRHRLVNRLDPDRIYPGQRMELPPVPPPPGSVGEPRINRLPPGDAPAVPPERAQQREGSALPDPAPTPGGTGNEQAAPAETASPGGESRERAPAGRPESDGSEDDARLPAGVVLAGAGSTLLAVGAVRAIRRRRRRRDHLAPDTMPVAGGDPDFHRRLVAKADDDLTEALGRALDDLAARVAAAGYACRPLVVQHGADHLDVLLDRATVPAVEGWRAQANGDVWAREPSVAAPDVDADRTMAAPLLVTLGQPDDGGQLYLDLEAARLVCLSGDPDVARSVACTMLTELAETPLATNARVAVVGHDLGVHRIDRLDRVEVASTWAEGVAADLASWNSGTRDALAANGWPNPFVARANDPYHDALIPLVVIASSPLDDTDLLGAVADGPAATAVVVLGDPLPGAVVVDCQRDRLSIPQIGLTCQPVALRPEEIDHVADLLESADDTGGEQLVIWPDDESLGPTGAQDDPDEEYCDPPYEILVRFLGDIVVETADGERTALTDKQTALVAYLALHREVGVDRVADALWATPAEGSPRKRLANLVNRCRRAIGGRYLPDSDGRTYRIGPGVATDVDLFGRRVAAAGETPPERAVEVLRAALELVRGKVFSRPGSASDSYAWIDAEIWVSTWELKVAAVTQRAAEMCLDLGDPAGAVEVAERILRDVVPTHPGLTETLMRAHAAAGNRHAIRSVYQAHVNALEQLDLDTVAPSTAELYERLRNE